MNSDIDIIIIKPALLECELVAGNFYPCTVSSNRWREVDLSALV